MSHPVFGDAEVHPVTGRHIEKGRGALPLHVQVRQHLEAIEKEEGKEVADRMRLELDKLKEEKHPGNPTEDHFKGIKKSEGPEAADKARDEVKATEA